MLLQICHHKRFWKTSNFSKTHLIFQKTQNLNVLRNLTVSVEVYGKFAASWWKKISCSETWTNCQCRVKEIGKHRVRKTFQLSGRFCFHKKNTMAQKKQSRLQQAMFLKKVATEIFEASLQVFFGIPYRNRSDPRMSFSMFKKHFVSNPLKNT